MNAGWLVAAVFLVLAGLLVWRIAAKGTEDFLSFPSKLAFSIGLVVLIVISIRKSPVLGLFVILTAGLLLSFLWVPTMVAGLMSPLTDAFTGGSERVERRPFYARAVALRRKGQYPEATEEIERCLTEFPDDFEGMMMLAEVQSDDLKDVTAALGTLALIAVTPGRPDGEVILALNRRADLALRQGNPENARIILTEIENRWPETEAARFAQQRLAHLPSEEYLLEQAEPHVIALTKGDRHLGLRTDGGASELSQENPQEQVERLVAQANEFPDDWEAREKLALIYANHFREFALAAEQLEALIALPGQPTNAVVRWLNELADIQLKRADGIQDARVVLGRIAARFPGSAAAANAESRIARLGLETKAHEAPRKLKLGVYESNLGLRGTGGPRPPTPPTATEPDA